MGRLLAFSILILLTATGLGAILSTSVTAFYLLKIAGALYLVYLGYRLWRSQPEETSKDSHTKEQKASTRNIIRQEFFVAITNPKAILIFTAFFPQFLVADTPMLPQFSIMGITFIVLEIIALILYAVSGKQLAFLTRTVRGQKIMNRTSGSLLIGAGGLLALSK